MSHGAIVGSVGGVTWRNADALVTAWMRGPAPMVSTAVPVGIEHVPPAGLQMPSVTGPPDPLCEKGRFVSAVAGTVIVRMILDGLITFAEIFVSFTSDPATTTPTLVF